jgi:hypothetical protein
MTVVLESTGKWRYDGGCAFDLALSMTGPKGTSNFAKKIVDMARTSPRLTVGRRIC